MPEELLQQRGDSAVFLGPVQAFLRRSSVVSCVVSLVMLARAALIVLVVNIIRDVYRR